MQISGNQETDYDGDDAKKLDFVVRRDAVYQIFGDGAVEKDNCAACCRDDETADHPTKVKSKIHNPIIPQKWRDKRIKSGFSRGFGKNAAGFSQNVAFQALHFWNFDI